MWDEKEIQKKYYELQSINEQTKKLQKEIQRIMDNLGLIENIKSWVKEISSVEEGKEILVPIADGIFVKARLAGKGFIVNVGSNTLAEKDKNGVLKLLDSQSGELNEYYIQLNEALVSYDSKARKIEEEFLKNEKEREKELN